MQIVIISYLCRYYNTFLYIKQGKLFTKPDNVYPLLYYLIFRTVIRLQKGNFDLITFL